jgi:tetratricopeptide (TPR) repeat protein
MNLRRSFVPLQLLFLVTASLITIGARLACGQETISLRSGQTQQVTILGTTPSGIKIQLGDAVMVQPFGNISAVTMSPPPEFTAARQAYENGDLNTALANAQAVVSNFRGLPTDWAREAMLTLGDIYVSLDQLPKAQAVYSDFQRAYPSAGTADINVGLAMIDLSKKDYPAAKALVDPILSQALKQLNVPKAASALFGRAFYVSGQIKEQAGDFPGALEDYLRTVTIYPGDRVAAAHAQDKADSLRQQHGITVP